MREALLLVLLLAASAPAPRDGDEAARQAAPVREVAMRLICQCGCNMVLAECNHQSCPFAIPERKAIAEKLAAGMTPDAIVAEYVRNYGRKILAAPTTSGFDLLAWVAPALALVVGTGAAVVVLRRWLAARSAPATASAAESGEPPASEGLLRRVEEELGREGP